MKKLLLTLMFFALVTMGFAQTTYYWAGGATATSLTGTSWSTTLGGAATDSRNGADDILVFDNQTVVLSLTTTSAGKLVIQNGADVTITRDPGVSGTGTLTLGGASGAGLDVNNGILRISGSTSGFNYIVSLSAGVTGVVRNSGQVFITGTASNRLSTASAESMVFESGSSCTVNSGVNPFDTVTNTTENTTVFKNGATLNYYGGANPFGSSTSVNVLKLNPSSTTNFYATPSASGVFGSRIFGNVVIKPGVTINLNSPAENFIKINDLKVESTATFNLRTSGGNAVSGNIVVDGVLGVGSTPTSSQLIMAGTSAQTISGSGNINVLGCFSVASDANVTLQKNITINGTSTSNVIGQLNFGTSTISGTGNFQFRSAATLTDNNGSITAGSNTVSMGNATNYGAISPTVGLLVTGTGIPANSYIIGTSSGSSSFTISNFATATATGVSITTTSGVATLATSNPAGPDASVLTSGSTKSIGSGSNLIINATTSAPFPTFSTNTLGNVTFNASATTNRDASIDGTLTLNSSKLTIRTGDNLTMTANSSFAGTGINSYIVTEANTSTGTVGVLKVEAIAASKLIPVGSAAYYLPVTLNPSASSDFSINVFQGATIDATPNGTALTALQKMDAVDAIYNINRTSGTGNCTIILGWQAALEGSTFAGLPNINVGVSKYTTSYSAYSGTGNNTSNTVSTAITDDTFGQFLVGRLGTLPVKLIAFTAKVANQTAVLSWKTTSEINLSHYLVQRSSDGVTFETLSSITANNKEGVFNYAFVDKAPSFGANYYRLLSVDIDGTIDQSELQSVNFGSGVSLAVYPNPTKGNVNIAGLAKGDVVKITDLIGRTLKVQTYEGESVMNLSLEDSNSGVYLIFVSRDGKLTSTNRIVKN